MTNGLGIDFDADMAEHVADMGATMTWSGGGYACCVSPLSAGGQIDMGGYFAQVSFRIIVRSSLFVSTRPTTGNKVTIGSTEYRILSVDTGADDSALVLTVAQVTG